MTGEEAHKLARDKGVSRIVAPNHQSFWDSFFIGVATKRHLRFMAKTELIEARYGRLLVRLGAFPVRRDEADAEALETARTVLEQGGLHALFSEGTRIRDPDELGHPRRGAGRLALGARVPLVPTAIVGTENLFAGPIPKPKRVQVAFAEPISVSEVAASPEAAGELVEGMLWPEVEGECRRLRSRPGLIAAGLTALGVGGGVLVRREQQRRSKRSWARGALAVRDRLRRRKRSKLPWCR